MARELLLGGRSVRVADDRTYRCGLGDVAHVAVRVAQLAIGGISTSGAPAAAAHALFLSHRAGCLGLRGIDRRRRADQSRWSPSVVLRWQLAVWVGGWVGTVE